MTQREAYNKYIHGHPGSSCPNIEWGPRLETYERWLEEGLSPELDPRRYDEWCDAFGLDRYPAFLRADPERSPLFETEILDEDEFTITRRNEDGSVTRENKSSLKGIPHVMRPAITGRGDWERFRKWLDPESALSMDLKSFEQAQKTEYPVLLCTRGLAGTVRNWLGFEAFAMMAYDDPDLLEEMIDACFLLGKRAIRAFGEHGVPLDGIHFPEDICYNSGPMMNPKHFRDILLPRYRALSDIASGYGYDRVSVDSDGNLWELLPLWIEGGVNFFFPLEVQAGMDINRLQEKYHGRAAWMGGIHKSRIAEGGQSMIKELERVRPAMEAGSYIPAADHNLVPEMSFSCYLDYLGMRHEVLGLGRGAPDRAKVCVGNQH